MTQDYARRKKRSAPKSNRKRKPARKRKSISLARWLTTIAGLGGLLALLVYLAQVDPADSEKSAPRTPSAEEKSSDAGIEYNFYDTLRERKVVLPAQPKSTTSKPTKPADTTRYEYILQAGSFVKREDAESRRIALLLLDVTNVEIEKSPLNGKTVYRVKAGPFLSRSKLANTRSKLLNEGIETLIIKRKAG